MYDAEWVVMDESTKRWIDHEDMCSILTRSTNPAPDPGAHIATHIRTNGCADGDWYCVADARPNRTKRRRSERSDHCDYLRS